MSGAKLRVTFTMPFAESNGGNRVIAIYAKKLLDRGHEVCVISEPYPRAPLWKRLIYPALGRGHEVAMKPHLSLFDDLGARHKVLERPRDITVDDVPDGDAVFATWWRTAQVVRDLPASKGTKFYLMQDYEMFPYFPHDEVAQGYESQLHKVAVSNYVADEVTRHHGQQHIDVVPNAVDLEQFQASARGKAARPTIGFLYAEAERKDVALAIEAITRARSLVPELRVISFGREEGALLPDWVEHHLEPKQADIPKLYAACDVWLFTSKHEGFGLPILEAMACRTPVLATRAGAAPELVTGVNGVLLDHDADAFAEEIARFAALPERDWRAASDAAYQTAQAYNWEDATDRLLACITARLP